jgi:hypothetical protein
MLPEGMMLKAYWFGPFKLNRVFLGSCDVDLLSKEEFARSGVSGDCCVTEFCLTDLLLERTLYWLEAWLAALMLAEPVIISDHACEA